MALWFIHFLKALPFNTVIAVIKYQYVNLEAFNDHTRFTGFNSLHGILELLGICLAIYLLK